MGAILGVKAPPGCERLTGWRAGLAPRSEGHALTSSGPPLSQGCRERGRKVARWVPMWPWRGSPPLSLRPGHGTKFPSCWELTHTSLPSNQGRSVQRSRTGKAPAPIPGGKVSGTSPSALQQDLGSVPPSQASLPSFPCGGGIASPSSPHALGQAPLVLSPVLVRPRDRRCVPTLQRRGREGGAQ